ncbi:G- coupled receptor GRL101 [Paramuricea clavata]|uniref:G- coupled receptor GRL101 n=1 Tax=Paramuricea clavata TaxID=317549 RepID=A0A6S7KCK6_PARCT|nr:G- coupled receptor GRL101 [Paramuricea clavata]
MLESNYQWNWTDQCEEAFCKVKAMVVSDLVLTHYDPNLPLQLACDASPVGIGAVLSHVMTDGTERPIAFASRSLSKAERNYAQIDKEALATVWGVKKFHNCLFDAHSKWPEVEIMPSTTSTQTIDRLRTIFPRYGVPAQVVTDNGPQFTSAEFQLFLKTNGIKLITTAPFHPATNGQAKRFVQSFKHAMKCEKQSASQLKTNMAKFLLAYRNSPHSTGESPSVLFLGRPLWTRLDLVKPDLQRNSKVMNRQIDQAGRKGHSPTRQLSIGQTVMARNYSGKDKWLPGIVRAQTGPLSYEIKSDDTAEPHPELGETGQNIAPAEEIVAEPDIELATNPPVVQQEEAGRATTGSGQRYPTRSHQPPERLGLNCLIRKLFKKTT